MAEKPVDVVKEEVEEYKVETFDNPIAAYSYEEHHARLVDFFTCLAPVICSLCSDHNWNNSGRGIRQDGVGPGPMSKS